MTYPNPPVAVEKATIDISESTTISLPVDTQHYKISALELPAAFTGTAITFQACSTADGTYQALYDDAGAAISVTVAQGQVVGITSNAASMALAAVRFIKLVSGSAELADREIGIILTQ